MAKDGVGEETPRSREMRRVLERWQGSGLRLGEFARREGLVLPTLYWWRRRLSTGANQSRRSSRTRSARKVRRAVKERRRQVSFTEVTGTLGMSTRAATGFEVVLSSGTTVRVPEGFEASSLRALIETLRGC